MTENTAIVEQPVATAAAELFPLGRLRRAPENVRTDAPNGDLPELAADIAGHGVLQNLVGYIEDADGKVQIYDASTDGFILVDPLFAIETGASPTVFIAAGGRRLGALHLLRDEHKAISDDYVVPVLIRSYEEAIELSLAENLARRDMNPVDEFRAFKRLLELHPGETTIEGLAKRFGYTERHIRQRLRLGDLHEDILLALGNGAITLDAAMAYASTRDTALQNRVFKTRCKQNWHNPSTIRSELSQASMTTDSIVYKYVGRKAYEAAGGTYDDDLFSVSGEGRMPTKLLNPEIVLELARPKIEKAVMTLAKKAGHVGVRLTDSLGIHGTAPKEAGLKLAQSFYEYAPNYRHVTVEQLLAAARKKKVATIAIGGLASEFTDKGEKVRPALAAQFLVATEDYAKIVPKAKGKPASPEEQEAQRRQEALERAITTRAFQMAVSDRLKENRLAGFLFFTTSRWMRDSVVTVDDAEVEALTMEMECRIPVAEIEERREAAKAAIAAENEEAEARRAREEALKKSTIDALAALGPILVARLQAERPPLLVYLPYEMELYRQTDDVSPDAVAYANVAPGDKDEADHTYTWAELAVTLAEDPLQFRWYDDIGGADADPELENGRMLDELPAVDGEPPNELLGTAPADAAETGVEAAGEPTADSGPSTADEPGSAASEAPAPAEGQIETEHGATSEPDGLADPGPVNEDLASSDASIEQ